MPPGSRTRFTATVTAPAPGTVTPTGGNVTFYANGNSLGSAALSGGTATLSTTVLPAGSDAITTTYGGDGLDFLGSSGNGVTVQVSGCTTGTSLNMSPATASYGGNLTLAATLLSGNTPLANDTITFSLRGNSVGSAVTNANGVATLGNISLTGYNAGNYASYLTANFAGGGGYACSAVAANLAVTADATVTALAPPRFPSPPGSRKRSPPPSRRPRRERSPPPAATSPSMPTETPSARRH